MVCEDSGAFLMPTRGQAIGGSSLRGGCAHGGICKHFVTSPSVKKGCDRKSRAARVGHNCVILAVILTARMVLYLIFNELIFYGKFFGSNIAPSL